MNLHPDQFGEQLQLFNPDSLGYQLPLFDDKEYETPKHHPTPGDLPFEEWVQRPDIVFHGTFRPDWEDASVSHMGTHRAAVERLETAAKGIMGLPLVGAHGGIRTREGRIPESYPIQSDRRYRAASYFGMPDELDDYDIRTHLEEEGLPVSTSLNSEANYKTFADSYISDLAGPGQIHARRIESSGLDSVHDRLKSDTRFRDADLNAIHAEWEAESGNVPSPSVTESISGPVSYERSENALATLELNGTLAYRNIGEDSGSTSHLVLNHHGSSSYYDDVAASPNQPPGVREHALHLSRMNKDIPVPFHSRGVLPSYRQTQLNVGPDTPDTETVRQKIRRLPRPVPPEAS